MIIKTRIFEISNHKYNNLSELAYVMGISVSQIYRVKEGKRQINQKFIIGAKKAFPDQKLDDLFYLAPELPTVTREHQVASAIHSALGQTAKAVNPKPDLPGQYLSPSPEERLSAIEKQPVQSHEV